MVVSLLNCGEVIGSREVLWLKPSFLQDFCLGLLEKCHTMIYPYLGGYAELGSGIT